MRVVATTNRNMAEEICQGNFGRIFTIALMYSLNTLPLASRPDDILPITTVLLGRHIKAYGMIPWLDEGAITVLQNYGWPGNVRELENVLQRALVLADAGVISASDILIDDEALIAGDLQQSAVLDAFRQNAAHA